MVKLKTCYVSQGVSTSWAMAYWWEQTDGSTSTVLTQLFSCSA